MIGVELNYQVRVIEQISAKISSFRQHFSTNMKRRWHEIVERGLKSSGDHWVRYGMLPKSEKFGDRLKWRFNPYFCVLFFISTFVKRALCLWFDGDSRAVYVGDFFSLMGMSRALWFFDNTIYAIASLVYVLSYLFITLFPSSNTFWFGVFKALKANRQEGVLVLLDLNYCNRFVTIAGFTLYIFQVVVNLFATIFVGSLTVSYLWFGFQLKNLVFDLFWLFHIFLYLLIGATFLAIQATYFFLVCLFVSYVLNSVIESLKNHMIFSKKRKVIPTRRNQIKFNQEKGRFNECAKLIRSCNRFFGEILKPFIVTCITGIPVFLFSLKNATSILEYAMSLSAVWIGTTVYIQNTVVF